MRYTSHNLENVRVQNTKREMPILAKNFHI